MLINFSSFLRLIPSHIVSGRPPVRGLRRPTESTLTEFNFSTLTPTSLTSLDDGVNSFAFDLDLIITGFDKLFDSDDGRLGPLAGLNFTGFMV